MKPIQTRDGKKARLIWTGAIEGRIENRIVLVNTKNSECIRMYYEDGHWSKDYEEYLNIVNVHEKAYWSKPEHIPCGGNIFLRFEECMTVHRISSIKLTEDGKIYWITVSNDHLQDLKLWKWSETCYGPWKECLVEEKSNV